MASTYDNELRIEEQATGENTNTWGTKLNDNALALICNAVWGYNETAVTGGTDNLTISDGAASDGRHASIKFTGTLASNETVTVPTSREGKWIFWNGTTGSFSLVVKVNGGTNEVTIPQGNRVICISDGSEMYEVYNDRKKVGKETIWVKSSAMHALTTNGADGPNAVELSAGNPELRTFDFDKDTDEGVQFEIAFPKSWDEGTITYQVFWTTTDTNNTLGVAWSLAAVALANDDAISTAYGTAVVVTDTVLGTANDLHVTAESSAVTIAGSPGVDELVY